MDIFTRDAVLKGPPAATRAFAIGVASAFTEATGQTIRTWLQLAGSEVGHYQWSGRVEGLATVSANLMAAMQDETYLAKVAEGSEFIGDRPVRDRMLTPLSTLGEDPVDPGTICSATTGFAASGHLGAATGWGLEMIEHARIITGTPAVLCSTTAGPFSELTFLSFFRDGAAADEAGRELREDDGYRKLLARGGPHFVDGATRTVVSVCLG